MLTYMNRRRRSRSFRRRRETGRWAHTYAALDLGTNNCRLLVARPTRDGFRVVDAFSRIVRLGEGMSQNEGLCEAAMDRTIAALEICAAKMRRNGVDRCRGVATEARSEEHTSELQSLMRISYAVLCLKNKKHLYKTTTIA